MKHLFLISFVCIACLFGSCSNDNPGDSPSDNPSIPDAGPTPNSEGNIIYYTASDWRIIEPKNFYPTTFTNTCDKGNGVITFDQDITQIPYRAFRNATGLSAITIPKTIISIEEDAFYGCTNLKSITLPATLTSIKEYAFVNSGLTSIYCKASIPPIIYNEDDKYNQSFSGSSLHPITVYVPKESLEAYKAATDWNSYEYMTFKGYDFKE